MRILGMISALIFILYGITRILFFTVLVLGLINSDSFSGINALKLPATLIGGALAIYGGVLYFKKHKNSVKFISASVILYIASATYEHILEHGIYFYRSIMGAFFWFTGAQLLLLIIIFISKNYAQANK